MHEEVSEEVNVCILDTVVFEDPDNFSEDEYDDDTMIASTHQHTK